MLRRAENLLASNGLAAAPELADPHSLKGFPTKSFENTLGESIKRRFKEVKDVSLNLHPSPLIQNRHGHTGSLSDVEEAARPKVVHSQTAPEPRRMSMDGWSQTFKEDVKSTGAAQSPIPQPYPHLPPQMQAITRSASMANVTVPRVLQEGILMTKVSTFKRTAAVFRLDADQGQIVWHSKKIRISALNRSVNPFVEGYR